MPSLHGPAPETHGLNTDSALPLICGREPAPLPSSRPSNQKRNSLPRFSVGNLGIRAPEFDQSPALRGFCFLPRLFVPFLALEPPPLAYPITLLPWGIPHR